MRNAAAVAVFGALALGLGTADARESFPKGPSARESQRVVGAAHARYKDLQDGKNADYIPILIETPSDLGVMGATLANGGVNPLTGKRVMNAKDVPELLAVMATAGFYDESGEWMYTAGLPAKKGVGGGIVAVVPGRFAIAAFSPRLDEAGNSVRSLNAIRDFAGEPGVGVFGPNPP
jgi:glutaminase